MLDENGNETFEEMSAESVVENGYLQFGQYCNSSRHLPRLLSGLKPVYECIIQALYNSPSRFTKLKGVLGDTSKLWPHGDSCLHADTLVMTNDGKYHTIKELYDMTISGEQTEFEVVSLDKDGNLHPSIMRNVRHGKTANFYYDVEINGRYHIKVTDNHQISTLSDYKTINPYSYSANQKWVRADYLELGSELDGAIGWFTDTLAFRNRKGLFTLYKMVCDIPESKEVVHHIDHNRKNNLKSNLIALTRAEHAHIHGIENVKATHELIHDPNSIQGKRKQIRDKLIAKRMSKVYSFIRAFKIFDTIIDSDLPITEENYESIRKTYNSKSGTPYLETVLDNSYGIDTLDKLIELYNVRNTGDINTICEYLNIDSYHGDYDESIYPADLQLTKESSELCNFEGFSDSDHKLLIEIHNQIINNAEFSNDHELYNGRAVVTNIEIVHLPEDMQFYDFTVDEYESAMFPLCNDNDTPLFINLHNSWGECCANLVYQGFAIGQGSYGRKTLRGDNISKAADRYLEIMMNPAIREQISKVYPQIPKTSSYMGIEMMEYIPTPLPLSLIFGVTSGIGLGISTVIPAFTPTSLYEAYKADDPTLLELNFGMKLHNSSNDGTEQGLKGLWETGVGSLGLEIPIEDMWINGDHGYLIHCKSPAFKPKLAVLDPYIAEEKVGVIDVTDGDEVKIFVYRTKGTRAITDDQIYDILKKACYRKRGFHINVYNTKDQVAQPIGMKDWIAITMKNYEKLHERYIAENIQAAQEEQWSWENYLPIVRLLNDENNTQTYEEIANDFQIPVSVVETISRRSNGTYRKLREDEGGLEKKIKACKDRLKWLKQRKAVEDIEEYIGNIKGRIFVEEDE